MNSASFDWEVVQNALPLLLEGLKLTVILAAIVIGISTVLAVPLAVARMSRIAVVRWAAQAYIELFRCTPLLIQLLWVFYALPTLFDIALPAKVAVVIALSGNLTAFLAEAYRSGMQSVPVEQIEAAQTLRLKHSQILRHVIIPQALRQQIPTILSLNVQLFKDTSLVSVLGVAELTFQGNIVSSQTYRPVEVFTSVAIMYFVVAFPITLLTSWLERRSLQKNGPSAPRKRGLPVVPEGDANKDLPSDQGTVVSNAASRPEIGRVVTRG
jgi:polar amino acid transport system permease protein